MVEGVEELGARNSIACASRRWNRRWSARSKTDVAGSGNDIASRVAERERRRLVLKAAVLNQWSGVRWPEGSEIFWPGTILGRLTVPELATS